MYSHEEVIIKFPKPDPSDPNIFPGSIQGPSFIWTDILEKDGETYVKKSEVYEFFHKQLEFDRSLR